jgi:hypothetical protein
MRHLLPKRRNVLTEASVATLMALMNGTRADASRNGYDRAFGSLKKTPMPLSVLR